MLRVTAVRNPASRSLALRLPAVFMNTPLFAVLSFSHGTGRNGHRIDRQVNRERRLREKKLRIYQQRLRQSAVELQFKTPRTVGTWYARQKEQEFFESDIFHMVIAWLPKFTSCRYLDPVWYWEEPLWRLILDIQAEVKGATEAALDADRLVLKR